MLVELVKADWSTDVAFHLARVDRRERELWSCVRAVRLKQVSSPVELGTRNRALARSMSTQLPERPTRTPRRAGANGLDDSTSPTHRHGLCTHTHDLERWCALLRAQMRSTVPAS